MKMMGEEDVAADYEASLSELTFNSKPHINMLTMLAEENVQFASKIVDIIESHLHKVPSNQTLPTLYLIDSIVKNLSNSGYKELFNKNLVKTFITVFEKADEKTRAALFKLRDTWTGYFAPSKLYGIDIKARSIDPAWPIRHPDRGAAVPTTASTGNLVVNTSKSIHVNPDFLKGTKSTNGPSNNNNGGKDDLQEKKVLLQRLEQKKRELDRLARQANRTSSSTGGSASSNTTSSRHHHHNDQQQQQQQLQSVVTVPGPPSLTGNQQRDPRLSRNSNNNYHRSSGSASSSSRDKAGSGSGSGGGGRSGSVETSRGHSGGGGIGCNRGGSAEIGAGDRRYHHRDQQRSQHQQQQQHVHDVDLRSRNNVPAPSLPPKKRKPQSPNPSNNNNNAFGGGGADSDASTSTSTGGPPRDKKSRMQIKQETSSSFPSSLFGTSGDQDLRALYRNIIKEEIIDEELPTGGAEADNKSTSASPDAAPAPLQQQELAEDEEIPQPPTPTMDAPDSPSPPPPEGAAAGTAGPAAAAAPPVVAAIDYHHRKPAPIPMPDKVRISIDAPEIADNSLGSILAYRDTILQRTEQQFAEGRISRQQYNDIMRDLNSALDTAQGLSSSAAAKPPIAAAAAAQTAVGGRLFAPAGAVGSIRPSLSNPALSAATAQITVSREMDSVPANNRIFVDGRAYEVRYIDDVAVIERNGLPHRIYFVGAPRDVVVDGFAHTLAFGESKTVVIDGQPHAIKFGAPSRELYMGPFPIRGAFGGPPIPATINGVRHKIQLCGPPPEVKIDPEPAHELLRYVKESHMVRSAAASTIDTHHHQPSSLQHRRPVLVPTVPAATGGGATTASSAVHLPDVGGGPYHPHLQQQQHLRQQYPPAFAGGSGAVGRPAGFEPSSLLHHHHQQQAPPRPVLPVHPQMMTTGHRPPAMDVMDLLSKLVNSGIITRQPTTAPALNPHHQEQMVQQQQQGRSATPPIPSKIRFGDGEVVERKQKEPDLSDFATAKMKVRYVSVIEALYKQKTQCTICGMRFPDSERQKYSKHLDWHFKQSRRDKDKSNLRPWYLAVEDWTRHEELDDADAPKAKSAIFESSQSQQQQNQQRQQHPTDDSGRMLIVSTDSVIPATDDSQECAVCGEKFEQFWDEDEEVWKMRNAVLIQAKAYHPLCYQDVKSVDSEPGDPSFAPLPDDLLSGVSNQDDDEEGKNVVD